MKLIDEIRCLLVVLVSLTGVSLTGVSCTDDGADSIGALRMVSIFPSDGATGVAVNAGTMDVCITFDDTLTLAPTGFSKVSAGDAIVRRVHPEDLSLTVSLTGVEKGKSYTLVVGRGTVLGASGEENEPLSVTFTTVSPPGASTVDSRLSNPSATESANRVYAALREAYGTATVSASMANVSWNISEAELVRKEAGEYPAIAFFDYIHLHYSPASWIDYNDTRVVEEWWNAGGIPGACWHWRVPRDATDTNPDNYTYSPGETSFRPSNIFVDGSWEQRVVDADLEEMAGYLLLLKEKGIPVIWRPLHEAAGNMFRGGTAWFWWGADGGETYVRLWRHMYDFFREKGVDNLIWVWTTEMDDSPYYPGDDYVDIVGRDLYGATDPTAVAEEYEAILDAYPNKMIALSECGTVAPLSSQWEAGARWVFCMPWYQNNATTLEGHAHAPLEWWKDALECGNVMKRGDLSF